MHTTEGIKLRADISIYYTEIGLIWMMQVINIIWCDENEQQDLRSLAREFQREQGEQGEATKGSRR